MSMKNFDMIEDGKTYVNSERPHNLVRILMKDPYYSGQYIASDTHRYYLDGSAVNHSYDLTTEVTVVITPVEAKKPRDCWVIYKGDESCVPYETRQDALAWLGDRVPTKDVSLFKIVHMREVMEGEE